MTLRLNGNTGYTEIAAPTSAGSNTLVLPTGNGTVRQTMMTDGAGALSFAFDAGSFFYRLDSNLAGANVNTAQSVFGVGVTLAASTVYAFDAIYAISKTAGTTSHTFSTGFGGTATINNIAYKLCQYQNNISFTAALNNGVYQFIQTAAATVDSIGARTAANQFCIFKMQGTVSINAGGTFIPQYTLSAAPGGAYTTAAGSHIKFTPIGAAGSASSQGTWS